MQSNKMSKDAIKEVITPLEYGIFLTINRILDPEFKAECCICYTEGYSSKNESLDTMKLSKVLKM